MEDRDFKCVFELRYMAKIKFSLNSIGVWPNETLGDKSIYSHMLRILNVLLLICTTIAFFAEISYVISNKNNLDFIEFGHTFITILMTTIFIQRLTLPHQKAYCTVTKEFILKYHLVHHKFASCYATQITHRVNKFCAILTQYCHYLIYMGLTLFNLVPLYKNYTSGMFTGERPINSTFEQAIYYKFPFDQYTNFNYYMLVFCYNWSASYFVIIGFAIFDLIICIITIHIWGHLSILKHNLENFPRPKLVINHDDVDNNEVQVQVLYTKEENNDVNQRLRHIIQYHLQIKEFMFKTSGAYGNTLGLYYMFHQITGCVFLLECSSLNIEALMKFGPLTLFMIQQLIQLSVIFELIGTKGDNLVDAVYALPWECMNSKNRLMVLLFLQNVQVPLALKAADVIPVGVTTMSKILRTSISYFMMLRTLS